MTQETLNIKLKIQLLKLLTPELDAFTVVRMARLDLKAGNVAAAVARLKVDADKIRSASQELYSVINTL